MDTMPPSMKLTKPSAPQYSMSGRMKDPSQRRDIGVGPGKYVLKDGVGSKSSISHRKTAQSFKFRKGDRFQGGMFQTEYSPGPGSYHLPRGIGSQSDSKLRSAPAIALAGREKFGSLASLSESLGPGPGAGGGPAKLGLQQLITQRQAPQAIFSRGRRTDSGMSNDGPGPGSYKGAGSVVSLSQYSSPPKISMASRHKLLGSGQDSAGPGKVRDDTAIGKQALSHRRSYGGFTFGARTPMNKKSSDGPGPGAYG